MQVLVGDAVAAKPIERRVHRDHFADRGADLGFVETQQDMRAVWPRVVFGQEIVEDVRWSICL